MLVSSLFWEVLGDLNGIRVKRIWLDFYGFLTEMFYTCFTLSIKCFTLLVVLTNLIIKRTIYYITKKKGEYYVFGCNYSRLAQDGR